MGFTLFEVEAIVGVVLVVEGDGEGIDCEEELGDEAFPLGFLLLH